MALAMKLLRLEKWKFFNETWYYAISEREESHAQD